jgi:hypothetical protein
VALRRGDVDLGQARLWVRRLKGGLSVEHPTTATSCAPSSAGWPRATTICPGSSSPSAASP